MRKSTIVLILSGTIGFLALAIYLFYQWTYGIVFSQEVDYSVIAVSPDQKKFLAVRDGEYLIMDSQTEKVLIKQPRKFNSRHIISRTWVNNQELGFHVFGSKENDYDYQYYLTRDLKNFKLIYRKDRKSIIEFVLESPNFQNFAYQNKSNQEWVVEDRNGSKWHTGLSLTITGAGWSNDDRYLELSNEEEQYLLDTKLKKIVKLDKRFSGKWAPTKNIYGFFADHHSRGFFDNNFYLFDPQKLSFTRFAWRNILDAYDFYWAPDNKSIAFDHAGEIFIINVQNPQDPPYKAQALESDGAVASSIVWTTDCQSIAYLTRTPTRLLFILFFKPAKYHLVKLNVKTGKFKKIYINDIPKEVCWIGGNILYYKLNHNGTVYRLKF